MGTEEAGWVHIANNLLDKCHVALRVRNLADCDAHVFVTLYEAVLGEKVPDYISATRSQERDAHNVQSVIDSLALDYLQVSLSHITGENVVRGDAESIQNLLEIFDGLLEYLSEQISEASSQSGDLEKYKSSHPGHQQEGSLQGQNGLLPPLRSPRSAGSSAVFVPSWEADESESTAELIRLGDTAHSFTARRSAPLGDLMGITRQDQPVEGRTNYVSQEIQVPKSSDRPPSSHVGREDAIAEATQENDWLPRVPSPRPLDVAAPARTSPSAHKKVAFRTLPDVRFVAESPEDGEEDTEPETSLRLTEELCLPRSESSLRDRLRGSVAEEPLSARRVRSILSEQELKEMSEKLSRRLDELDRMLKEALEERGHAEDKLSQHSDSIMEIGRKQQLPVTGTQRVKSPPSRARSVSSPPDVPLCSRFEDALQKGARGETGRIRRQLQRELDQQRVKSQVLSAAYEERLRDFQRTETAKLSASKTKLRETEQEFKENFCKDPPKISQPGRVYSRKQTPRPAEPDPRPPNRNRPLAQMRVRDNDLLPLVLDEFPQLRISPHALTRMWRSQSAQVELLGNIAQEDERSQRKLQREVEEAHKKFELLRSLITKEQGHNQRLKDFRDRIRLQKSAQNKMREKRQQGARAKRYYHDYHVQLRAKMLRARTREERIVKKLFADGLQLQRQRLQEMRLYAEEQREAQRKRHKDELESMENYYKDQFSMLADAVVQERHEIQAQEKAQSKTLQQMKRELRGRMEREIRNLQETIVRADEDAFFRELEAERFKRRLQMASFQYSKSHGL